MKRMKKIASILLAVIMVLGMSLTAFATSAGTDGTEGGGTSSTPEITTEYELFQIFVGNFKDGKLSNAKWGVNGTGDKGEEVPQAVLDALTAANTENATDLEKLEVITKYVDLQSTAFRGTIKEEQPKLVEEGEQAGSYKYENLPSGYYLIKGKAGNADGTDEAYTLYAVQVIGDGKPNESGVATDDENGDLYFKPKRNGVPTPDKKVKDKDDSAAANSPEAESDWQNSADYDIGDDINYQLSAVLPDAESMAAYDTYKLVFQDVLCKALDVNEGSIVVKMNGVTIAANNYGVRYNDIQDAGLKKNEDERTLVISFVNVKAIGAWGGETITVEYNAKLNDQAEIGTTGNKNEFTLKYSNDPNNSGEGHEPKGKTPPKTAIVFTFKTVVNKVEPAPTDENPNGTKALVGAAFSLEKLVDASEEGEETAGEKVWKEVKKFEVTEENVSTFDFSGLDAGRYKLIETKTPAGYNSIEPIYFTIEAKHTADNGTSDALTELKVYATNEEGGELTGENVTGFEVELVSGTATTDIVNKSGSILPSTGGIGTTIFYVVGSILVIGAGILLVAKKRMGASK